MPNCHIALRGYHSLLTWDELQITSNEAEHEPRTEAAVHQAWNMFVCIEAM